jgi:hypothetical protein
VEAVSHERGAPVHQALEKLTEEKRALILRTSQLVATLEASETQVYF